LGLYGALIIEPREPEAVRYDREYTYILDELALDFTPRVALGRERLPMAEFGNGRGGALHYDLFLMNGRAGTGIPPVTLKAGERVRIRLINVGSLPHAMHIHGHFFTIVATDGNPVPPGARLRKDTVLIGPGERYDLELVGYNPGVWMFHCHMQNHAANGMMTTITYDGFKPLHEHQMPLPALKRGQEPPAAPPAVRTAQAPPGRGAAEVVVRMADNRFEPPMVKIPVGTQVTWVNRGINAHTTTGLDVFWDSPVMVTGRKFSVTFTQPGTYRYLCREHFLNGMIGTIEVTAGRGR